MMAMEQLIDERIAPWRTGLGTIAFDEFFVGDAFHCPNCNGNPGSRKLGRCRGRGGTGFVKYCVGATQYYGLMLRYHGAFYLPRAAGETVVAEALDFPGAVTQGFNLSDARLMIAGAMEDLAQ